MKYEAQVFDDIIIMSLYMYTIMMSESKGNTLYYCGVTISHEGKKLNNAGDKASCANSPLHTYGLGL